MLDRFSNWFYLFTAEGGSKILIKALKRLCRDFGVPVLLTSNGGTEFSANDLKQFTKHYGIEHRVCSLAFPHSNSRAEIAVKTAKRLINDNTLLTGELDTIKLSPAQLLFVAIYTGLCLSVIFGSLTLSNAKNIILGSNGIFQKFELDMSCSSFSRQLKISKKTRSEQPNYNRGKVLEKSSGNLLCAISRYKSNASRAVLP